MKLKPELLKRIGFITVLKHFVCFVGILLVPFSALSQGTGIINGVVADSLTGEEIFGANVFITEISKGAATDINGEFEIANIPVGSYDMRI